MTQQKIHGSQIDASDIDLTGVEGSGLQNVDAITLEGSSLADIEQYVDAVAQGLKVAPAVKVATTGPLGGTYTPGPGSPETGVGGTLNLGPLATLDIDDVTTWAFNDGILVKDQANAAENGRYRLSQVGDGSPAVDWILTRCEFCDESTEIPSSYVFVQLGTVNGGTGWVALVGDPATFVVDTDPVTYSQFSGAGTYTAGTGIDVTGTTISIENSGVVANTYGSNISVPAIAIDATGRITTATDTAIRAASTSQTGIVQLNDSLTSTSTSLALTAAQGKVLQDSKLNLSGGTMTGRLTTDNVAEARATPTISGGTLTLDLQDANIFEVARNANITTLTISNAPASGTAFSFTLKFNANGTAYSVTWPGSVKWPGGTAPTLTSTNGKSDVLVFLTTDGGTNWYGYVAGLNS